MRSKLFEKLKPDVIKMGIQYNQYSVIKSIETDNMKMLKELMDYSQKNNILLNINEKDDNGNTPLLLSVNKNNVEMTKLLVDYANTNNIILEVNEKNDIGHYPLVCSIVKNNVEITKLVIDYAIYNNIILKIDEKDIENIINNNSINSIENINEIDIKILRLIGNGIIEHRINMPFSYDSKLLKLLKMEQDN